MVTLRAVFTALVCLSLAALLCADEWATPLVREVFSKNRGYFIRITPGESWGEAVGFSGAKTGKHAVAEIFHVQPDKGYRLEREITLLNPVAPVDYFVSDMGDLITLDNWHNAGYGSVLVLYHADGKLVRAYKLTELFPKSEVDSFPESVSSIWWHKGPMYIDPEQKTFYMGYKEAPDYRELILKLSDGSVRICTNNGKYQCRDVS